MLPNAFLPLAFFCPVAAVHAATGQKTQAYIVSYVKFIVNVCNYNISVSGCAETHPVDTHKKSIGIAPH